MRPCEGRGGGFNSPRTLWQSTLPCLAASGTGPPKAGWPVRLWHGVLRVVSRLRALGRRTLVGRFDSCTTCCRPGPREGIGALNLGRACSTPALAAPKAGDARRAGHRPRNADEVGSSPTAGSCSLMTPGPDGQAVGCNPTIKQVRLLPASPVFRCSSGGKSVALKTRRPLVRVQPPELATVPYVRSIQTADWVQHHACNVEEPVRIR